MVVTFLCKFSVDESSACGDIIYSNCKVASHDQFIEGSWEFMKAEPLAVCHIPDKSCDHKHCDSGNIIFSICQVGYINFWVEAPHSKSSPCHVWWS